MALTYIPKITQHKMPHLMYRWSELLLRTVAQAVASHSLAANCSRRCTLRPYFDSLTPDKHKKRPFLGILISRIASKQLTLRVVTFII